MPNKDPDKRKAYHREYMKKRLASDPEFKERHLKRVHLNDARYRDEVKLRLTEFKNKGCMLCPETEHCCLSAHHVIEDTKEFNVGDAARMKISASRLTQELLKCVCLCENCHRKVHAGILKLPDQLVQIQPPKPNG
jgi:hypothetical protein